MRATLIISFVDFYDRLTTIIESYIQPVANVLARTYVAWVFFASGLTKIRDWESTLMLFEYEYSVPVLNFEVAAYMATVGELILPVLLAFGLTSRISALGLSIVNVVAVYSLEDLAIAALYSHVIWGVILLYIVFFGGQKLSVDFVIRKKFFNRNI